MIDTAARFFDAAGRRAALYVLITLAAAAAGTWQFARGAQSHIPRKTVSAIKAWKGGELLACMVTVDGARLQEFAHQYNVVMMCGTGRGDADRFTDRAITVSRAFSIEPHDFAIEEAVSGPMRVLLDETAARNPPARSAQSRRLSEMALWYELVLLPTDIDPIDVRTLSDVERLGGKLLLTEPRWSVIDILVP